ncbi:TBC1 domain family member 10A isoform X2 [Erinaceus europaeus]|uniref:TBC1 domain family member 10A isoform X2 n=1 Tax=Erinaceus europaeus TaxID=9365 RepID=A0ABM3XJ12_ERIEU|nr:TBC1 domain family member 10A isoform X2 [Erinaceus europaeus]
MGMGTGGGAGSMGSLTWLGAELVFSPGRAREAENEESPERRAGEGCRCSSLGPLVGGRKKYPSWAQVCRPCGAEWGDRSPASVSPRDCQCWWLPEPGAPHPASVSHTRLEEVPLEVLRQRESKWLDMLNNWDKWMAKRHKKIRLRCQKGIPPSLRGRAWQYLSGGKVKLQQNPGRFDELDLSPGDPKWLDVIERDLHRQFPFHEMFVSRGGHGQQDLFRVLKAYTLHRPEEGYCQAQAPIAAVLLMHMPAEQAFWCLVQICEKYLPGYYSEKLKVCPAAHKHLSRQKIDPLLYMTEWFMCAFARTLPWSSVLRVWDMFFCEGVKIIFRVGLVLLKHALGSPDKLRACQGQYETIERLRSLSPRIMQEAFLVQEVVELPVTERQIEREHLIQLRRWQQTRGELQCLSPPRLHGAKAILEAEPGPWRTLKPAPSIRLPIEGPPPGTTGATRLHKPAKEQRKQTKAKPPDPSRGQAVATAGDTCIPQDVPPKDLAHLEPAPQDSAHHQSRESLTSQGSEDTYL